MNDGDDELISVAQLALLGVDILEKKFGFDESQSAAWVDEFLERAVLAMETDSGKNQRN